MKIGSLSLLELIGILLWLTSLLVFGCVLSWRLMSMKCSQFHGGWSIGVGEGRRGEGTTILVVDCIHSLGRLNDFLEICKSSQFHLFTDLTGL